MGARRPAAEPGGAGLVELLAFRVGSEEYVVDVRRVREVVAPLPVRRMPRIPAFLEGVADLRGEVIPIVDARRRFGLVAGTPTRKTKLVVVQVAGMPVGLVVDAVHEVLRIPRDAIRAAPPLAGKAAPRLFLGVVGGLARAGRGGEAAAPPTGLKFLLNVKALLEPIGPDEMEAARARASAEPG
jgi:purine-binding chemotaxis protein CheW